MKQIQFPDIITVEFIQAYLKYLEDIKFDDERAHSAEDSLYFAVIEAIALDKCVNPKECAIETLKTEDISFARWCS